MAETVAWVSAGGGVLATVMAVLLPRMLLQREQEATPPSGLDLPVCDRCTLPIAGDVVTRAQPYRGFTQHYHANTCWPKVVEQETSAPPPKVKDTLWFDVMGIPLDVWYAAGKEIGFPPNASFTPESMRALVDRREAGEFLPKTKPKLRPLPGMSKKRAAQIKGAANLLAGAAVEAKGIYHGMPPEQEAMVFHKMHAVYEALAEYQEQQR